MTSSLAPSYQPLATTTQDVQASRSILTLDSKPSINLGTTLGDLSLSVSNNNLHPTEPTFEITDVSTENHQAHANDVQISVQSNNQQQFDIRTNDTTPHVTGELIEDNADMTPSNKPMLADKSGLLHDISNELKVQKVVSQEILLQNSATSVNDATPTDMFTTPVSTFRSASKLQPQSKPRTSRSSGSANSQTNSGPSSNNSGRRSWFDKAIITNHQNVVDQNHVLNSSAKSGHARELLSERTNSRASGSAASAGSRQLTPLSAQRTASEVSVGFQADAMVTPHYSSGTNTSNTNSHQSQTLGQNQANDQTPRLLSSKSLSQIQSNSQQLQNVSISQNDLSIPISSIHRHSTMGSLLLSSNVTSNDTNTSANMSQLVPLQGETDHSFLSTKKVEPQEMAEQQTEQQTEQTEIVLTARTAEEETQEIEDPSLSISQNITKSVSFRELHGLTDSNPLIDTSDDRKTPSRNFERDVTTLDPPLHESTLNLQANTNLTNVSNVQPLSSPSRSRDRDANGLPIFDDPTASFDSSNPNFSMQSGNTTNRSEQLQNRLQRLLEARRDMMDLLQEDEGQSSNDD